MKRCCSCREEKPLTDFWKSKRDGYRRECKKCDHARTVRWQQANKEQHKENQRRWFSKSGSKPLFDARSRAKRLVRKLETDAAWRRANGPRMVAKEAKRRATELSATPSWANEFFIGEAYHLASLRTKATGFRWHVDHIVPLQSKLVCGLHVENNLQVVPASVNLRKSNVRWPDMPERRQL